MMDCSGIGLWDVALALAVTVQATVLVYKYHRRWKAFILMLPIPFTIATMAVGRPVDATHVLGLVLLLLFMHAVRVLHYNLRLLILPSVLLAAGGYCVIGWVIASSYRLAAGCFGYRSCNGSRGFDRDAAGPLSRGRRPQERTTAMD